MMATSFQSDGISIIIPTYNRSSMLRKILCGLLAQKGYHKALQVIIVDNGSTENITAAISEFRKHLVIAVIRRKIPKPKENFRPGSARNIGVLNSRYDYILFLDSDCIPSEYFLRTHWRELSSRCKIATIGHRVFIDECKCSEEMILHSSKSLSMIEFVRSASNYLEYIDRRIPELIDISRHPAPYNCFHGCNVGMRRADFFKAGMFDISFDGHWGYEDIELGYRLYLLGIEFVYLYDAFVYHIEGEGLSLTERLIGRNRNFALACKKIPNYFLFRKHLGR